jgi:hypothetical protein
MFSFGESNHPFKQTLIDYSKKFNQSFLKYYKIVYDEGIVYHNLDLSKYIINSHNFIEGYIILSDFFNMNLKRRRPTDTYQLLWEYCTDESDNCEYNFNENGEPLFTETALNGHEIWLEEITEDKLEVCKNLIILTTNTFNSIPSNYTLIDIQFDINIILQRDETPISKINKKHIEAIINNIKKNAYASYTEQIISHNLGIIQLNECKIKIKNNLMNVIISVKVENNISVTNNEIKDIILSVFPAINGTYQFKFIIDSSRSSNYLLQFIGEPEIHSIELLFDDIIFE